jgi:hypothetical protein
VATAFSRSDRWLTSRYAISHKLVDPVREEQMRVASPAIFWLVCRRCPRRNALRRNAVWLNSVSQIVDKFAIPAPAPSTSNSSRIPGAREYGRSQMKSPNYAPVCSWVSAGAKWIRTLGPTLHLRHHRLEIALVI